MNALPGIICGCGAALALLVLYVGLPKAKQNPSPWRWRLGIVTIAAGLAAWPPIYWYLAQFYLDMVWIVVWGTTIWSFQWGFRQAFLLAKRPQLWF